MWVLWCLLLIPSLLRADELTQKMTGRVSEEADAFIRLATQILGTETLHQHAQKPPSRFRPRVGAAAQGPPPPEWKERTIVSEYGFVSLAGPPASIHELRQVVAVDGHKVEDAKKAQVALAKTITATDDAVKKEMLKQFEKYGLVGAATDFGQLLLLFTRRELERYEFTARQPRMLGYDRVLVFAYKQLDGPEALTLIEANKNDRLRRMKIQGEIWVRSTDFVPMRITLATSEGDGAALVREDASVDYAMSPYGALLPVSTDHRETRGGKIVAENQFTYTDFHRFGASSDIKFEAAK